MIVKNEEENIRLCLDSVKDDVDEIIIVDTGSTDKTVGICKEYTNQVYFYKWNDDFSEARNESIKYATKDWILILDADELIPKGELIRLKDFLPGLKNNIAGLTWLDVHVKRSELDKVDDSYLNSNYIPSQMRTFRNKMGYYYKYALHEQLVIGEEIIATTTFTYYHYGLHASDDARAKRNIRVVSRDLKTYPDDLYVKYNYARCLNGVGDKSKMIDAFDELIELYIRSGKIQQFLRLEDIYDDFINYLLPDEQNYEKIKTLSLDWISRLVDKSDILPYFYLGQVLFLMKEFDGALKILNMVDNSVESSNRNRYLIENIKIETKFLLWAIYCEKKELVKSQEYYDYLLTTPKKKYLVKKEE